MKQVRFFLLILTSITATCIVLTINVLNKYYIMDSTGIGLYTEGDRSEDVKKWMELKQNQTDLSKLGRILFLGEERPKVKAGKRYQILIWKYGPQIEKRLLKQYSNKPAAEIDPFEYCPVRNCDLTYKDADIKTADIVMFHLHRTRSIGELPRKRGKNNQIWTFLTDESPHHTFWGSKFFNNQGKVYNITNFNGIFNWSMSYRSISDIPVPYGRTVVKRIPSDADFDFNKQKDVLVAIMGSNCNKDNEISTRWGYVKELQKHIKVDVYGKCGTLKCPGHYQKDCPLLDKYLFYLAFENSNCDEYITEKLWWNAYQKNSIPIVMGGGSCEDYKQLLPPNSFLNVEDFANPASLASFILRLNETKEYINYYKWKTHFTVLNEHGYFKSKSVHYCRICEAMNYNSKRNKVYTQLEDLWGYQKACRTSYSLFS